MPTLSKNTNKLFVDLDNSIEEIQRLKEKFTESARQALQTSIDKFFATYPELKAIVWTQYTPYFNDGDACVFNVNDPAFVTTFDDRVSGGSFENDDGDDEKLLDDQGNFLIEHSSDVLYEFSYHRKSKELSPREKLFWEDAHDLSRIICSESMQDVMLMLFDNHVIVTLTPGNPAHVAEYSHD